MDTKLSILNYIYIEFIKCTCIIRNSLKKVSKPEFLPGRRSISFCNSVFKLFYFLLPVQGKHCKIFIPVVVDHHHQYIRLICFLEDDFF